MKNLTDPEPEKVPLCKPNYGWAVFMPANFWLAASAPIFLLFFFIGSKDNIVTTLVAIPSAIALAICVWICVLFFTATLGLPVHFLLKIFKQTSSHGYVGIGTLLGSAIMIFCSNILVYPGAMPPVVQILLAYSGAIIGGSSAFISWRNVRPDLRK